MTGESPAGDTQRLALVLWNGDIGGAEILTATLAQNFRAAGVDARVVFVGSPGPLAARLEKAGIPFTGLRFARGRDILLHPRRYAAGVSFAGADGALLPERGFMGIALRVGGYRERVVAVEHGPVNQRPSHSATRRMLARLDRAGGARAADVEVAVSDYVLRQMSSGPHAKRLVRIHHGIDAGLYPGGPAKEPERPGGETVVGFMGRLVKGKGVDRLIQAVAQARQSLPVRLVVAGDGPERAALTANALDASLGDAVSFLGVVDDVPGFWRQCDVAAVPSAELDEAFSMVTLEAMASGRAVVASRSGAIPELVIDGETGTLIAPGDAGELARAITAYAKDHALRRAHGAAAHARALQSFDLRDTVRAYLGLFAAP